MADYASIQRKVEKGRGKAAARAGVPYNAYRIPEDGEGDFIKDAHKIYTRFKMISRIGQAKLNASLETDNRLGMLWFELTGDFSRFKLGDVFLLNDSLYGVGRVQVSEDDYLGLALAANAPGKKVIGARISGNIRVRRVNEEGDSENWNQTMRNSKPLRLIDGQYVFGEDNENPDLIPAGIQAHHRTYGDRQMVEVPAMPRRSTWAIYVPPLPGGFMFQERDRIIADDGSIYEVLVPFYQGSGVVGHQLFCEREVSNA